MFEIYNQRVTTCKFVKSAFGSIFLCHCQVLLTMFNLFFFNFLHRNVYHFYKINTWIKWYDVMDAFNGYGAVNNGKFLFKLQSSVNLLKINSINFVLFFYMKWFFCVLDLLKTRHFPHISILTNITKTFVDYPSWAKMHWQWLLLGLIKCLRQQYDLFVISDSSFMVFSSLHKNVFTSHDFYCLDVQFHNIFYEECSSTILQLCIFANSNHWLKKYIQATIEWTNEIYIKREHPTTSSNQTEKYRRNK